MTPDQILDAAATKIERDGWSQQSGGMRVRPSNRPSCVMHAIACAAGAELIYFNTMNAPFVAAVHAMSVALGLTGNKDRIWQWNDARGRTQEEVTSMLRAVAMSLRAAAKDSVPPVRQDVRVDAGIAEQIA